MTSRLADIERLSLAERIQLVQDIWDTIVAAPEQLPVTEAQRQELDRRLDAYRQNPQGGVSWQEIKAKVMRRP
jgi:putative addiction module component (TIGR02574 family)